MTGPSIHVIRARKLLFGGLVGGLAAAVFSLVLFTVLDGTRGLASAALWPLRWCCSSTGSASW